MVLNAQRELTLPQVATLPGDDGILPRVSTGATYKYYRDMRRDPTIALAVPLMHAIIQASPWSVEATENAPEGAKEFIDGLLQPIRLHILSHVLQGNTTFGWQPFEKVFSQDNLGRIVIHKLKPLLQDITNILVDSETGAFAGLQQTTDPVVTLETEDCLLITIDVEGTNWYGWPLMENVRAPYNQWLEVEKAAMRYDKKIAGASIVIKYPRGFSNLNGVPEENASIAKSVLNNFQASGGVILPSSSKETLEDDTVTDNEWSAEILSDASAGRGNFTERQKYLDALKVRGFGLPERAVLEGQFGTKAEAEAHADFAITNQEVRHEKIVLQINWHLVNQLLRLNYGEEFENTVYVVPSPVADVKRNYLKSVYNSLLNNPMGFAEEIDEIDRQALRDQLGIPSLAIAETSSLILPEVSV